jgi:hypothetical protein
MLKRRIHTIVVFLFLSSGSFAQLTPIDSLDVNINIDSLIADSIRKEFILTHKPLTAAELQKVVLKSQDLHYGSFLKNYMQQVDAFATFRSSVRVHVSKREPFQNEWIFYVFLLLLLFLAWVNHSNPLYLKNLFRVYIHEGFVFRQTKDQMEQSAFTSFLYNTLFVFSGSTFLFFGTGMHAAINGWERWAFLGLCCLLILLIYIVKFIFLMLLGWLFEEKESFGNYIFLVYLNVKIIGLIMLFASLLMAFSSETDALRIFQWVGFGLIFLTAIRLFRGFALFSRKMSLPVYLFFILSLELIPNAVLVKVFSNGYELLLTGIF